MRFLTVLVLCVILLTGCWTGLIKVDGVYMKTMMSGQTRFYADLIGRDDIQVTHSVYHTLLEYFEDFGTDTLYCDFEHLPGSDVYDQVTYCDTEK